jgi:hypothetical protein
MTIVVWLLAWGVLSCLVSPLIGGLMRFGLGAAGERARQPDRMHTVC